MAIWTLGDRKSEQIPSQCTLGARGRAGTAGAATTVRTSHACTPIRMYSHLGGFGGERARARAAISEPLCTLERYRVLNPTEDSTICSPRHPDPQKLHLVNAFLPPVPAQEGMSPSTTLIPRISHSRCGGRRKTPLSTKILVRLLHLQSGLTRMLWNRVLCESDSWRRRVVIAWCE